MKQTAFVFGAILCISLVLLGLSGCFMDRSREAAFEDAWGFSATIYGGGSSGLDEETAIVIATTYINEVIEDSGYAAGYTYHSIRYDPDNTAWLVTFMPEEGSTQLPCHVVLGTDGSVMYAWGELPKD